MQLWMYGTPIIYPLSTVPEQYRLLILVNPMTSIIEGFRLAFLGVGTLSSLQVLYTATFACVVLLVGMMLFSRAERTAMDTV